MLVDGDHNDCVFVDVRVPNLKKQARDHTQAGMGVSRQRGTAASVPA